MLGKGVAITIPLQQNVALGAAAVVVDERFRGSLRSGCQFAALSLP